MLRALLILLHKMVTKWFKVFKDGVFWENSCARFQEIWRHPVSSHNREGSRSVGAWTRTYPGDKFQASLIESFCILTPKALLISSHPQGDTSTKSLSHHQPRKPGFICYDRSPHPAGERSCTGLEEFLAQMFNINTRNSNPKASSGIQTIT